MIRRTRLTLIGLALGLVALGYARAPTSATAAVPGPGLAIHAFATPTHFSANDTPECVKTPRPEILPCDAYQITVTNAGSRPAEGPIVMTDTLPPGLTPVGGRFTWSGQPSLELISRCELEVVPIRCEFPLGLAPDETLELTVDVTVEPGAAEGLNTAEVFEGGGAFVAKTEAPDIVNDIAPPFGPNALTATFAGSDGAPDRQAGGHPYEFTTRIDLNNSIALGPETTRPLATSIHDVRDVVVDLPLGFLGGATATPKCTFAALDTLVGCPSNTQVGHIMSEPAGSASVNSGIYNMVPEHGVAAEFGYVDALDNTHAIYASVVPSKAGYVLRATSPDVPQVALTDIVVTFFGNPAVKDTGGGTPSAMFTNPSYCSGSPLTSTAYMDSWQHPGSFNADGTPNLGGEGWVSTTSETPSVTGCNALRFVPESFSVKPDTAEADSPSGLAFSLRVPQSEAPDALATPPLRRASVMLPVGLSVNPAAANGLAACSPTQIGWLGGSVTDFTPTAPSCPDASKVGSVELTTPLLEGTLVGSIYLATQDENPFHSLLAGYIVVNDPATGIVVKIAGNLILNPKTGQITGVFDENPQLPFTDLELHFLGGSRGVLTTPQDCGTYTTTSDLSPWSAPESGPDATPSDSFNISSGCVKGFSPSFAAGTTSSQAGAFSSFTTTVSRSDQDEALGRIQVTTPPGLLGMISSVPLCDEVNANAGTCPASSQIGHTTVAAGSGPSPVYVPEVGQPQAPVYLTSGYRGAPFGLSVVVPAVAGPFNLGTVVVRASISVNPHTSQVSITSDPLPQILQGVPLQTRFVNVTIDRPGFIFNATNCKPLGISGEVFSAHGTMANVASYYQATNCAGRRFKPVFTASVGAKASKAGGASFEVKVAAKGGPQAGHEEANIGSVKVDLPKQLPSRLATLQKACLAKVFEANPAACPKQSNVGSATAVTPVLTHALNGPAYLVSHGGAAFPDLEVVLQGEGITLILDGNTQIKNGITSSTFKSVPDAPISSFEIKLPTGPFSALAAYLPTRVHYNFCGQSLRMPTFIAGQNGAVIKQTTKIAVRGCPKGKVKSAAKRRKSAKRRRRG